MTLEIETTSFGKILRISEEIFMDAVATTNLIDWLGWTEKVMKISGSFEGNGEDWGNPVGNFDGAYLTCGLLGFTWKWNNQPPMINEFVKRKGKGELMTLMPRCGEAYLEAVEKGEKDGAPIVSAWSVGERVKEPYFTELKNFWSCAEMKKIQTETALTMMGDFARRKTLEGQSFYNLPKPLFSHFAYWFDQAVLNGTGKTQSFDKAENISIEQVFDWMKNATGYTQKSFDKNLTYWRGIIDLADAVQKKLWILAYLRSSVASDWGDTVTMCRRGSLALGSGYINDSFRKFDFAPSLDLTGIKPNTSEFLKLATEAKQEIPAERLVRYKLKYRPDGDPRYWAIVDFNQHSKEKRLYVFDAAQKNFKQYYVAHGKGSDADHNGMAETFLNIPNSNASSLGIYRCAEAYPGTHEESLRLDGLENNNSNARDRAIVLHKADYVSKEFIDENGKIGRSNGCFVVENSVVQILINQLKNGSFIIAWKE